MGHFPVQLVAGNTNNLAGLRVGCFALVEFHSRLLTNRSMLSTALKPELPISLRGLCGVCRHSSLCPVRLRQPGHVYSLRRHSVPDQRCLSHSWVTERPGDTHIDKGA